MRYFFRCLAALSLTATTMTSCTGSTSASDEQVSAIETPVTVDTVKRSDMVEYADLSATATFLQKNIVKANTAGYIQAVNVHIGQYVTQGTTLFRVKTKEAQSIGNAINKLDPSFGFSGLNDIKATRSGYIAQMDHQLGDYIQDGEQLAIITDKSSFAFLLNVPYELHSYVKTGNSVRVMLPDGNTMNGHIASELPTVDSLSQAQTFVIKTDTPGDIPENLIARVQVVRKEKQDVVSVPKTAVLADDTQTDFWVMKMINDSTAVKVLINKGLETSGRVEILSGAVEPSDIVLTSGNFGLPDTAAVKVTNR